MTPKRLQQRRTKGWQKPDGAISVARPHKWGNPFKVGEHTAEEAVRRYRQWLPSAPIYRDIAELTGRDLMCWCPLNQPCHADVLLELANLHNEAEATAAQAPKPKNRGGFAWPHQEDERP
jgi:hypothetical protein